MHTVLQRCRPHQLPISSLPPVPRLASTLPCRCRACRASQARPSHQPASGCRRGRRPAPATHLQAPEQVQREMQGHVLPGGLRMRASLPEGTAAQPEPEAAQPPPAAGPPTPLVDADSKALDAAAAVAWIPVKEEVCKCRAPPLCQPCPSHQQEQQQRLSSLSPALHRQARRWQQQQAGCHFGCAAQPVYRHDSCARRGRAGHPCPAIAARPSRPGQLALLLLPCGTIPSLPAQHASAHAIGHVALSCPGSSRDSRPVRPAPAHLRQAGQPPAAKQG